jgi:hypothetical protein
MPNEQAQELLRALVALVAIADEMIPEPDGGLSNWQLNEAEHAIHNAHRLIAEVTSKVKG